MDGEWNEFSEWAFEDSLERDLRCIAVSNLQLDKYLINKGSPAKAT
jgi:hypothetical protein